MPKLLLTSFQTWLAHQTSNSSDDLVAMVESQGCDFASLFYLRQLPVDIEVASQKTLEAIAEIRPDGIICCGMAESRTHLTIESNAVCGDRCFYTRIDLPELIASLSHTGISNDAGKFVCEGLYYQVLNYVRSLEKTIPSIFVHVPQLDLNNQEIIRQDFYSILKYFALNSKNRNQSFKQFSDIE